MIKALWILSLLLALAPLTLRADELALAHALADEQDWDACRLELDRITLFQPELSSSADALRNSLEASRKQHTSSSYLKRLGALPVKAMVAFYRVMVAPALGSRCSLSPSCSAYSLQAARERGALGLPMTGDRLIREPDIVSARAKTIVDSHGNTRVLDPISDHIGFKKELSCSHSRGRPHETH